MQHRQLVGQLLSLTSVLVVGGLIWFSIQRCAPVERDRMFVVLFLTAVSVVFWSLFEQAGSTMNLFADRNVDREIFGTTIRASQLQFVNPAFIILLAPVMSGMWLQLGKRQLEPNTPMKFVVAVLLVGAGFAALVVGAQSAGDSGRVALGYLVFAYFLHTVGELCLSPVGLSMVTRLSLPRVMGLMMGVWFLSSSVSHYVAGLIAGMASVDGGSQAASADSLQIYSATFLQVAEIAAVVAVGVLVLTPLLKRRMHLER